MKMSFGPASKVPAGKDVHVDFPVGIWDHWGGWG